MKNKKKRYERKESEIHCMKKKSSFVAKFLAMIAKIIKEIFKYSRQCLRLFLSHSWSCEKKFR